MIWSVASVCLKLSNLTTLPCFHTFFHLHHTFKKNFYVFVFVVILIVDNMLSILHIVGM